MDRRTYFIRLCAYILDAEKHPMKEVLAIVLLTIPTVWELFDDRNGDNNHAFDVFVRVGWVVLTAIYPWWIGHSYFASIAMAGGIFVISFDYLENIINLRRKDWFSFLGTSSKQDKIKWWREMKPLNRFLIRVSVFTLTSVWYWLS